MAKTTALAATLLLSVAAAPSPSSDAPAVLKAVTDCRATTDPQARLACYDTAVARLDTATAKKDIVVLDREEVRQTRRGLFGFTLPKLPFFKGDDSQKQAETLEVNSVVQSSRNLGHGKWHMVLENGAIWENTETITRHDPRAGSKIRIRAGAMTNYFLSIDGDPAIRGKRVG